MNKPENNYRKLCDLQSECESLSLRDSILITEYIKSGNSIDALIIALDTTKALETKLSKAIDALKGFTRWEPKGVHLIPDKYGRFMDAGQVYQVIKELEE